MSELKNTIFNKNIAEDTSNILLPDTGAVGNGIGFKSNINSNSLNGYLNLLSENIQYLQFTGGLYSDDGDYHEGSIASLVIKKENDYSINQFRRNSNNSKVLNNNPPIKDANILTVNGIDIYEGGTFNDDWDKMSAEYSIEAIANTVMGRDNEGASNVKMPADVHDDTVINNKYLNEQIAASNTEIDKKLETSRTEINKELEKKQNKLTAGKNIEISEDNVISAAGDLSTKAANVTYDNSKTNLEYISGYDFPKFKTPIADTINLVITNADGSLEYPAAIKKQEDGSYRLKAELQNVQFRGMPVFLKLADNKTDIMGLFNTICQFFDFSELAAKKYNASEGEITVRGAEGEINIEFSFDFTIMYEQQAPKNILLNINVTNIESIPPEDLQQLYENITITYDIKNRVLREPDRNIFYYISKSAGILELKQENNKVKLTGKVTNDADTSIGGFYFYNPVIENYFNLTSEHTAGITSSTGKPCKWNINKISGSLVALYLFLIKHQDESNIQEGDVFTFNLTPDKNAELEAVKGGADNVQEAIEAIVSNKIKPIGAYYTQYAKKDGSFDDNESPENLFGGTWQLMYADEGVGFITEGGFSNENRVNGIQQDAIKNITGSIYNIYSERQSSSNEQFGALSWAENTIYSMSVYSGKGARTGIVFNAGKVVNTGSNVRIKNRQIRIFLRIA